MAQAQPNLPPDVNQFGLTMRKPTGLPMLIVSLYSPNKTYDALFLANYANINIIDALYRVPGRRRGAHLRRRRLRDAHLGQAGPAGAGSASRCRIVAQRGPAAEHGQPVGPGRRAARRRPARS